jgi:hypothetical protein
LADKEEPVDQRVVTARVVQTGGTNASYHGSPLQAPQDRRPLAPAGVPEDLRALVGKREEKRSLRTKDPEEARRRLAEAVVEIEHRWAQLRAGPTRLSERDAHELATTVHDQWLARYRDNPSEQTFWPTALFDRLWAAPGPIDLGRLELFTGSTRISLKPGISKPGV